MRYQALLDDDEPSAAAAAAAAALQKADITSRALRCASYPPISSIAETPRARLERAAASDGRPRGADTTVLYLAYGSNMAAATLLGMRRIRPLSQVNVSVPMLRLTFDLPGVPYREPCFANVDFRTCPAATAGAPPDAWDGRLMGVVYELTGDDWRTIMRTEGAGSSYREVVVPCFAMTAKAGADTAFFARTLYAPSAPDDGDGDECPLWQRLTSGRRRPSRGGAQASARYLGLLRDGAREHGLPAVYQAHLASLQPYTATHWRQTAGQAVFLGLWGLPLLLCLAMAGFLADATGRLPPWLAGGVTAMFNLMWASYDAGFKPVFGDGERTEAASL